MRETMRYFSLLLVCLASALPLAAAGADGWTRFGGPAGEFVASSSDDAFDDALGLHVRWRATIGTGLSSVVVANDLVYVTYLQPFSPAESERPESERRHTEGVAALSREKGEIVWDHRWEAGWLESQEAFGGKSRAPQATPLLDEDRLVVLGFTGWLRCLDRSSGRLLWKKNLVDDFAAQPVQFGFSASPIVIEGQLIVMAGGQKGGLVAMDLATGEPIWNVPCDEASYATPVSVEVDGVKQIVCVTRIDVIGVEAATGTELWRFPLPKTGKTNVPTPLPLGEGRLAFSGQGWGGTCELRVSRAQGGTPTWEVTEGWRSRAEFFYCNWILRDDRILGCTGDLLLVIDAQTGERLARWRGFRDSNLVRVGDRYVIVDGEGVLSLAEERDTGWQLLSRYQAIEDRCWAPVSIADGQLFCRGGNEVACFAFAASEGPAQNRLTPLEIKRAKLPIKERFTESTAENDGDPIDQIVTVFEETGPSAAWQTYLKIRESAGTKFTLDQREQLAEMAMEQGLVDFGQQILQHGVEDFATDAAKRWQSTLWAKLDRQPSPETIPAENGLVYLELGLQNQGERTIQTIVKGPSAHPFSYGIPFPPGKLRIEKWPVGTRLFRAENEKAGDVLLTVKAENAGHIIPLGKALPAE